MLFGSSIGAIRGLSVLFEMFHFPGGNIVQIIVELHIFLKVNFISKQEK